MILGEVAELAGTRVVETESDDGLVGALVEAGLGVVDPVAGQHDFAVRCASCHGTTVGEKKIGPALAGVFGHASGSVAGFRYSPALKNAHLTWDEPTLDKFLQNPGGPVAILFGDGLGNEDMNELASACGDLAEKVGGKEMPLYSATNERGALALGVAAWDSLVGVTALLSWGPPPTAGG